MILPVIISILKNSMPAKKNIKIRIKFSNYSLKRRIFK
jgi:hypothetical protein